MANKTYLVGKEIQDIYKASLGFVKRFGNVVHNEYNIHEIHRECIGYWPSRKAITNEVNIDEHSLPNNDNALVVPFYHGDMTLAHIRLVFLNKGKFETTIIGDTKNGWFNLLNAQNMYQRRNIVVPDYRIKVYDKLMSALSKDDGIHSDYITVSNMRELVNIGLKLSLRGNHDFIKKFSTTEGFDITIGETNLQISDWDHKNFCFDELRGLDLRAVIPKARNYLKTLPSYERLKFNQTFIEVFKYDLRNAAPYLFETFAEEKKFLGALKEELKDLFSISLIGFEKTPLIKITDTEMREVKMPLTLDNIEVFFASYHGDIVEYFMSKGMIPSRYYFNLETESRFRRYEVQKNLVQAIFTIIVGMLKDGKTSKSV